MFCVAFLMTNIVSLVATASVNYCGSRMCGNTNAHTFCQYPEGPSPHCVGYIKAPLSTEEKGRLMARLNRRRDEAASGRLRGLPPAGNMLKLRWVEELAREAQRWADQCRPPRTPEEHDVCRDLYSIPVGQCVASVVGEAPGLRVESMVDMWHMQSIQYKGNVTFYMPPVLNISYYGDFGQIMWSRSYMVGCGRSRFMSQWHGRLRTVERLVCNLAPKGPVPARALWAPAAPITNCPPRSVPDKGFNALCNFQLNAEDMSFIDNPTTPEENILLDTVLQIESNQSLNYLGSLDEMYLTQLAVATLGNTVSTQSFYNSLQRREVVDMSELQDSDISVNEVEEVIGKDRELNMTVDENTVHVIKTPKKKLSLVGRPKSYNIEDLTVDKHENHSPSIEHLGTKEKDIYSEYEIFETEENTTMTVEVVNMTAVTEVVKENISSTLKENLLREYTNATLTSLINMMNTNVSIGDMATNRDGRNLTVMENLARGFTSIDKSVDDYLSDPETVRQLQDALDRMEHTLEVQQITERQGKVRREIPRLTQDIIPLHSTTISEQLAREIERNKTIARGPMMNMVLKYMPYLKEYQSGFSQSTDASELITPSIVIIILCIVIV